MLLEQIPSFLHSMNSLFQAKEAIQLTLEQYSLMKEAINEATKNENDNHDQVRLYGILGRVSRRMKKEHSLHLWSTEYEYIANSMLTTLKLNDACRLDDTLADINEIYQRTHSNNSLNHTNSVTPSNNKRFTDKQTIVSIFG